MYNFKMQYNFMFILFVEYIISFIFTQLLKFLTLDCVLFIAVCIVNTVTIIHITYYSSYFTDYLTVLYYKLSYHIRYVNKVTRLIFFTIFLLH